MDTLDASAGWLVAQPRKSPPKQDRPRRLHSLDTELVGPELPTPAPAAAAAATETKHELFVGIFVGSLTVDVAVMGVTRERDSVTGHKVGRLVD